MKIPNYYIEKLDNIIERIDTLNAGDLFLAYKSLSYIEQMFEIFNVPVKDPKYERLFRAKMHVDTLLIGKLAEYEVLKMRVECYETKA